MEDCHGHLTTPHPPPDWNIGKQGVFSSLYVLTVVGDFFIYRTGQPSSSLCSQRRGQVLGEETTFSSFSLCNIWNKYSFKSCSCSWYNWYNSTEVELYQRSNPFYLLKVVRHHLSPTSHKTITWVEHTFYVSSSTGLSFEARDKLSKRKMLPRTQWYLLAIWILAARGAATHVLTVFFITCSISGIFQLFMDQDMKQTVKTRGAAPRARVHARPKSK